MSLLLIIKTIAALLIVIFWVWGGLKKGRIRDNWCTLILSLIALYPVWWMFLVLGAFTQFIRLGYGAYEYGGKNCDIADFWAMFGIYDREGRLIRGTWGFIVGLFIGGACFFGGYVTLPVWIAYVALNTATSYLLCKLHYLICDPAIALSYCSIMFFFQKII